MGQAPNTLDPTIPIMHCNGVLVSDSSLFLKCTAVMLGGAGNQIRNCMITGQPAQQLSCMMMRIEAELKLYDTHTQKHTHKHTHTANNWYDNC